MPEHIQKLIELAEIYFEDGAAMTAAERLQSAADEMRIMAAERAAMIQEITDQQRPNT